MSGTSNISLRQFQHIANQDLDGNVRLSREQDGLVNKGTLGQKIASFFSDIGQALGLIGDGNRAQRQESTLQGFSQALRGMYGNDIANQALQHHEIDPDSQVVPLTGRTIAQVIETAKQARDQQIEIGKGMSVNQEAYQDVVDDLREQFTPRVKQDLESRRWEPTGDAISKGLSEYENTFNTRLQDRCRMESDLFRNELTPREVLYHARQELSRMVSIEEKGVSFVVSINERDLKDQSIKLFTGDDKERALKGFVKAMNRLEERGGLPGEPEKFVRATFARDLSELINNGDEKTVKDLGKVQHELLQPNSVLMKAYHDESTDVDTRITIEGLVGAMARVMGPVTDSVQGDIDRIKKQPRND